MEMWHKMESEVTQPYEIQEFGKKLKFVYRIIAENIQTIKSVVKGKRKSDFI